MKYIRYTIYVDAIKNQSVWLTAPRSAKSYTVYKNMNFIHLLLSQVFTVIFQFRTSNSLQNYQFFLSWRRNVILISKRSKGLLT